MSDQRVKLPNGSVVHLDGGLDAGNTSDGWHTFNELYDHRMALTLALTRALPEDLSWRSKKHHPTGEPMFDDFFIVGINLPTGKTITYHYKLKYWELFGNVTEIDFAPVFDGHAPQDVVDRLLAYGKTRRYQR
jgi:hypothetical protein